MKKPHMHIYQDTEGDYLEIRFGEATPSRLEKIGPDTFQRIDEVTGEIKGFAIFNLSKSNYPTHTIDIETSRFASAQFSGSRSRVNKRKS